MKYRIADNWCLRGYSNSPYVLINTVNKSYYLLTQKMFSLLLLCDGVFDIDFSHLTSDEEFIFTSFIQREIIVQCDNVHSILTGHSYYQYPNRFVPRVHWSITRKCNYRCRHCYMESPLCKSDELSTEECKKIIDQMVDSGVLSVDITGGEPFARSDFWDIVDYLIEKDIKIELIYTNGSFLNESVIKQFELRGIKPGFSISFDGIGWHDWMRGISGAEKMALKALKIAQENGYYTNVEMCIFKGNRDVLFDSIELLKEYGVAQVKINTVISSNLWNENSDNNSISFNEYLEFVIANMDNVFLRGNGIEILFGSVINVSANKKKYSIVSDKACDEKNYNSHYLCNCIRNSAFISPDGRLCPCMSMSAFDGDMRFISIFEKPLVEQFSSGEYIDFITATPSSLFKKNPDCDVCDFKYRCLGGCRSLASMNGQNVSIWGTDKNACTLFKEGYIERIIEKAALSYEKADKSINL